MGRILLGSVCCAALAACGAAPAHDGPGARAVVAGDGKAAAPATAAADRTRAVQVRTNPLDPPDARSVVVYSVNLRSGPPVGGPPLIPAGEAAATVGAPGQRPDQPVVVLRTVTLRGGAPHLAWVVSSRNVLVVHHGKLGQDPAEQAALDARTTCVDVGVVDAATGRWEDAEQDCAYTS